MKKHSLQAYWLIFIAPLLAFPLMINVRVFPFVAPNEEPKWAILTICALWIGLAAAGLWWQRKKPLELPIPSISGIFLSIYLLILGIGIFLGPNQTEGFIRFAFWLFCVLVFMVSAWAIKHEKKWLDALVWSVSLGSFIFSLRYWESYFLDYGKPNYNIHVLFSPIGHVNFTGDVLIMLLPFLIWALAKYTNPALRILNWISVSTLSTILLVASSRGALGGIALATCVMLVIVIKHYRSTKNSDIWAQYKLLSLIVFSALVASVLIYLSLPFHYRDLARVSATAGQATTSQGKITLTPGAETPPLANLWVNLSPLLGARTPIFASTSAMALEAPILGQGTGNFAWVYPSFSNRYPGFRDPLSSIRTFTTNPHNVVLQIASQNGIPAMLIFMGLLLYFWWQLFKTTWQTWDGYLLSGLAALTAALFDAMFNHVFFNPASMFVFALLTGSWWGVLKVNNTSQKNIPLPAKPLALFALVAVLLLSIWPMRWVISEWYTGKAMAYARLPAYETDFYQKAYDWDKENFRATFGMGQVMYKQKKYKESAAYFSAFEKFYPYNPPALNMLGAAYMMAGDYTKAVTAFQQAVQTYPGFEMAEQNLQRAQALSHQQQKLPQSKQ
jgi:O-antigen ligase